jgi:O-antigen/teichoic acid export membrane protein
LRKNISWLAFSNLLLGFSQWFIVIILNRVLGLEAAGVYSLALGITAPIFIFSNMNLNSIFISGNRNNYNFSTFYIFRFVTSFLAIVMIFLVIVFSNYEFKTLLLILTISGMKLFESQSNIIYAIFQKKNKLYLAAYSKIIRSSLVITVLLITINFTTNILNIFFTLLIVYSISYVIDHKYFMVKKGRSTLSFKIIQSEIFSKSIFLILFLQAMPLAFSALFDSLSINIQRVIIESELGLTQLGLYSSITFLIITGQTIVNAVSQVLLPKFVESYKRNIAIFTSLLKKIVLYTGSLGALIAVVIFLIGDKILVLLYGEAFGETNNIFSLIIVAGTLWYITGFMNTAIISTGKYKAQLIPYFFSFAISLIFTGFFTERYNLEGSAGVLIMVMLTRLFIMVFMIKMIINRKKKENLQCT